ncbi:hypothetical protein [Pseudomonas sp. MWU12-2345]|uniref:hypothetical protein n=1 Tax=Pseudomonas sp. MWU12-2345 TaxID=2928689 RepID=UPI0020104209|nr:hypothetical protein [Pseudomonas sp. MWU12-2345]
MNISMVSVEIVIRKMEFLKELHKVDMPDAIEPVILEGIKSQASFAAFKHPKLLLHPISINHLKTTADIVLDGGFIGLDSLRKEVYRQLTATKEKESLPRSDSKGELLKTTAQLKRQISILRENNMNLTYVIREILDRYKSVAVAPPASIRARYATDASEIHSMLAGLGMIALVQ